MTTIGIYTPYRRDEVTAAALRLADLALSLSLGVRLLTSGRCEYPVHPFWDQQVTVAKGDEIYRWASGASKLVWFEHAPKLLHQTGVVTKAAEHIWVPIWHRLPEMDLDELEQQLPYAQIVCPGQAVYRGVFNNVFDGTMFMPLYQILWCSGLNPIKRTEFHEHKFVSMYVPIDSTTIDETGMFCLRAVEELLESRDNSCFTLDCSKSWPKEGRRQLRRLQAQYPNRLQVHYRSTLLQQKDFFHAHDWTWLPMTRSNTGMWALRSLACGTPVVAPNLPPYNEFIQDKRQGLLVDYELTHNWLDAPLGSPRFATIITKLQQAFTKETLVKCRRADWELEKIRERFIDQWSKLLLNTSS